MEKLPEICAACKETLSKRQKISKPGEANYSTIIIFLRSIWFDFDIAADTEEFNSAIGINFEKY